MGFGNTKTSDIIMRGKDMSGQTVVITGARTGIGAEMAWQMAAAGARCALLSALCTFCHDPVTVVGRADESPLTTDKALSAPLSAGPCYSRMACSNLHAVSAG